MAAPGSANPFGYQRVYGTRDRPINVLAEVRSGDVVLVPHGWHGPAMAPPGYDMYYLNVMAGPGPRREWLVRDDPDHAWVRKTWGLPEGRLAASLRWTPVTERIRLTVAQAVVKFLARQYSERDGVQQRLIEGCFGIFGHGNIAGLGQALMQVEVEGGLTVLWMAFGTSQCRNEQAMVHTAVGFSRMRNRLQTMACTTSVGPGATNLVTGAALATINRIPVLLLPGDVFATRASGTVLQQLESPRGHDISVNDTLRPVSVFFDRVWRPEQLPSVLLGAMRALTDPVNTGAVTIALPQDVQAEAWDWPVELFDARVWHVARPLPEAACFGRRWPRSVPRSAR